jgi:hypothetical protein
MSKWVNYVILDALADVGFTPESDNISFHGTVERCAKPETARRAAPS